VAEGKWVTVPGNLTQSGKPERRYQMKSGQYRETEPNSAEWYNQMYKQPVQNARSGLYDFFAAYDGDPGTNPGDLSRRQSPSSGLSAAEQRALIDGPEGAAARVGRIRAESDALVKEARSNPDSPYNQLFSQAPRRENLSDDSNPRDSALTSMRQQYAPGADIWSTDEGKAILEAAKTNTYSGDAAGLAQFNTQQRQAGIGANDEIIDALGYTGDMAKWAEKNPALAMREYNKKFGNSYGGFGSGDANTVLPNGMTAGEDARQAAMNAAAIMEGTGRPREINTAQMAPAQPAAIQAQNNNDLNLAGVGRYVDGLEGKKLFDYAKSLMGAN
jgi:hypothetical protein